MAKDDDVEVVPDSEVSVVGSQEVVNYLRTGEVADGPDIMDRDAAARAIIERVLTATNAADILAQSQTVTAKDMLDVPLEVRSARFLVSKVENSEGYYALIDALAPNTDGELEPVLVTCGARKVLAQLIAMDQIQAYPFKAKLFRKPTPTAAGFHPIELAPVE